MITQQTVIIGANSEIAKAIAIEITSSQKSRLILISRDFSQGSSITDEGLGDVTLITVKDYTSESIQLAIEQIKIGIPLPITRVFVCNGVLHNQNLKPEKRLEDFDTDAFNHVITANTLTPMLWIQKLTPILIGKTQCKIVVFSARVGSISDNNLGGWYSYRASKAALNMMLKTAAIELARRAKNIKIIAFHPGTTDTSLSKPFQKNVPENKLFTCDFVAKQLVTIIEKIPHDGTASFLDWKGDSIGW